MALFKRSQIYKSAHVIIFIALLVATNSLFIVNYPGALYALTLSVALYVIVNLNSRRSDIIFALAIIVSYGLVSSAQIIHYGALQVYTGGLLFIVVLLYLKYHKYPTAFQYGIDIFIWIILLFFSLEALIKLGLDFPGSVFISEKLRNIPTFREDVFRLTAFYGTPLILGPIAVLLILREITLYRRKLYFFMLMFILLATGSRSSFLIVLFAITTVFLLRPPRFLFRSFASLATVILLSGSLLPYILSENDRFRKTFERTFSILSAGIVADESILARADTSGETFIKVLSSPAGITFGLEKLQTSDSAIASISQQNGILFTLGFFSIIFILIFQCMPYAYAWMTSFTIIGLSLSVGGALSLSPLIILVALCIEMRNSERLIKIRYLSRPSCRSEEAVTEQSV
jgi:hypothetical protein